MKSSNPRDDLIPKVKAQLRGYEGAVLMRLLPEGRREGREWVALNPRRPDRNLGSFRINLNTGRWADFATGDSGGDLIALWAYIRGVSQVQAARDISALLRGTE